MRLFLLLWVAVATVWPVNGVAQQARSTPPRRFDAEVAYLTFSWAARPTTSFAIGPEIGAGFLKEVVLAPSADSFTGLVHVGVTSTLRIAANVDAEVGVRAGLGELKSVACAGCALSGYGGLSLGVLAGSRRLRFGTRFLVGTIEGGTLRTWSPFIVRLRF
jgi:hypothetical protein